MRSGAQITSDLVKALMKGGDTHEDENHPGIDDADGTAGPGR
jgi:hypothetical protein